MKLLVIALLIPCAFAQTGEHWVSTWATSPQSVPTFGPPRPPAAAGAATAAPPARTAPPRFALITSFHDQTIRMVAHTTIAGSRVRVELSNAFGREPLAIGAAHIALRDKESAILPASDQALMFSGHASVSIPPGAMEISDPVNIDLPAESDVAVSLYVPEETKADTMHMVGLHTTYIAKGDAAGQAAMTEPTTSQSYYWLANIDVAAGPDAAAIVAYGDSITDGATSTPDTNRSWPSFLAQRLAASRGANIAVLNQGISGNQILRDGAGVNALARFDRDVLAQPGVKWMTIMEGINDIGLGLRAGPAPGAVTADDLIAGLKQMIDRAHEHGIKVIGCTLTPFEGAAYYSDAGEQVREQVNQWIRTGGAFDAVVDFDAVTRDPANPKQIRADFNIRDHLHPNDAGYKAMADAIDLSLFGVKTAAGSH